MMHRYKYTHAEAEKMYMRHQARIEREFKRLLKETLTEIHEKGYSSKPWCKQGELTEEDKKTGLWITVYPKTKNDPFKNFR